MKGVPRRVRLISPEGVETVHESQSAAERSLREKGVAIHQSQISKLCRGILKEMHGWRACWVGDGVGNGSMEIAGK